VQKPVHNFLACKTIHCFIHNLHSYPLNLQLAGDVTFLDDGRLQIEQISQNALDLEVVLGNIPLGLDGKVYLTIPTGGTFLNYLSTPIKP